MTELLNSKILLIGAGKMGGALLQAWLHAGVKPQNIAVVEVNRISLPEGVRILASLDAVRDTPDCIVLAVKPQAMEGVLQELEAGQHSSPHPNPPPAGEGVLLLSIAAGKTLAYFNKHLPHSAVVRAMPNMPAIIRKGITALVANANVKEEQKKLADSLMQAAGETLWLNEDSEMDAVTAISGSGPAYVFLFMEALIAAGVAQGLAEDVAKRLAMQTMRGSVKLALKSDESLEQLRKNVTSPGGTTEAALKVLIKEEGLNRLVDEAVKAAVRRAGELA